MRFELDELLQVLPDTRTTRTPGSETPDGPSGTERSGAGPESAPFPHLPATQGAGSAGGGRPFTRPLPGVLARDRSDLPGCPPEWLGIPELPPPATVVSFSPGDEYRFSMMGQWYKIRRTGWGWQLFSADPQDPINGGHFTDLDDVKGYFQAKARGGSLPRGKPAGGMVGQPLQALAERLSGKVLHVRRPRPSRAPDTEPGEVDGPADPPPPVGWRTLPKLRSVLGALHLTRGDSGRIYHGGQWYAIMRVEAGWKLFSADPLDPDNGKHFPHLDVLEKYLQVKARTPEEEVTYERKDR